MIVDLFCGGGGASLGIKWATGRCPDVAVNHNEAAIRMHEANHPKTVHLRTDVFEVEPRRTVKRREVELLWASPDCTHFSRAKGKAPRSAKIRSLAWVVVEWAREVQPRIIALENVPEFVTWGPLFERAHFGLAEYDVPTEEQARLLGQPIPERAGEFFRAFTDALSLAGYRLEWRTLRACDYGAPTTRERFFLVARCDGEPIVWPEPTHGSPKARVRNPSLLPWRTAAECIDWSIPCPSIFMTREEAKVWAKANHADGVPQRPLAEATQRRIAEGIRRYVLTAAKPFVMHLTHGGRVHDVGAPLPTVTAAHRGELALVAPHLLNLSHGGRHEPLDEPARTITASPMGGDRALVAAFLAKHYGGVVGHEITRPLGTVTSVDHHSLVAAHLTRFHGRSVGGEADSPLNTVTSHAHDGLVAAHLTKFYGTSTGSGLDEPVPTVTSGGERGGGHVGLVAAFLLKFYQEGGQWSDLAEPMHTIVTKARMGLVTVTIDGEEYAIVDIGMRMLAPHELARAQGFPDDYVLTGSKADKIARIGNSVPPKLVEAVVRANLGDQVARRRAA